MSLRFEILLHGEPVGRLEPSARGGTEFRLLDEYRERVPRPVLGQRFEDDLHRVHRSRKGEALPDFFANLLPEGPLREVLEKRADIELEDDLALLAFVGADLPGAVEARPLEPIQEGLFAAEGDEQPPLPPPDAEVDELRFSLAGVQLKFSMVRDEDRLTLPARNRAGSWIVKLDSPRFPDLAENELSMLKWAEASGFDTPEIHLHPVEALTGLPRRLASEGSRALAVRRYDRTAEGRVHQEDFAQAVGLPPRQKYEHVTYEAMAQLAGSFMGEEAAFELVRRLAFMVAAGNGDAHLKNWSMVYPGEGIEARWSPLYDQVSTVAWPGVERNCALKLAGVKEFGRLDRAAFERLAERAELDRGQVLREVDSTLERLRSSWEAVGGELPLPKDHRRALEEHWRRTPLLRNAGPLQEL